MAKTPSQIKLKLWLKRLLFRGITLFITVVHRKKLVMSPHTALHPADFLRPQDWLRLFSPKFCSSKNNRAALNSRHKILTSAANQPHQLLVDISELVVHDAKSGIQRVVRSILLRLWQSPLQKYTVRPVYWDGMHYRYANQFIATNLRSVKDSPSKDSPSKETLARSSNIADGLVVDGLVKFSSGDIFLGLDLSPRLILGMKAALQQFRASGVKVYSVVYDILLIDHPEWFSHWGSQRFFFWLETVAELSNGLACISQTTAQAVENWLTYFPPQRTTALDISTFYLGADIDQSLPSGGLPENAAAVLTTIQQRTTFLMVGTIEPRKGYAQAIEAFNLLWASDFEINLVIVGKAGWKVEPLIQQIANHSQLNSRLFWLSGISDEYLEQVYASSTALLAASEGEGFGLPLIEAAQRKLPIIARKLPIFEEVAKDCAFYFQGSQPSELAAAVKQWLTLNANGTVPDSTNMPWLTWAQSTEQLLNIILSES